MDRIAWWREARFGMFVHWGLYSIPGRGEWWMWWEKTTAEELNQLADSFNPNKYKPSNWIRLAQQAGMKYMVLTTRHHDGFSLFDSKASDFTSTKTACGRDLVKEYVKACRKHGMPVGLYYSLLDWRFDAYHKGPQKDPTGWRKFIDYVHAQVEELMTNYGKIDLLWYDGGWPWTPGDWQSEKLNAMVRRLQPDILINDRSGTPEDFCTQSEQMVTPHERDWECCMPLYDFWWGHIPGDSHYKTPYDVIRNLTIAASHGGNYILSIGPKADGSLNPRDGRILRQVGGWLEKNGESIYGTSQGVSNVSPAPLVTPFGGITRKPGKLYLHVLYWHPEFPVADIKEKVTAARFLETGAPVSFSQQGERLWIRNLPAKPLNPYNTVIVCDLEG